MKKRGMTLIELMVAMTIFITVMTLAIGGFVAISRSRILIGNMKDSQQKLRVANEMIMRYAKQAEYVSIDPNGTWIELYFDIDSSINYSAKKFALSNITSGQNDLLYSECLAFNSGTVCSAWTEGATLLGSQSGRMFVANTDVFDLSGLLPSVLEVRLNLRNEIAGYEALSDDMSIENAIILGSLK